MYVKEYLVNSAYEYVEIHIVVGKSIALSKIVSFGKCKSKEDVNRII
jgi:hypothetical protein